MAHFRPAELLRAHQSEGQVLARAAFRTLSRTAGLARPSAVNMARPAVANFATTGEYKTLTEYDSTDGYFER